MFICKSFLFLSRLEHLKPVYTHPEALVYDFVSPLPTITTFFPHRTTPNTKDNKLYILLGLVVGGAFMESCFMAYSFVECTCTEIEFRSLLELEIGDGSRG